MYARTEWMDARAITVAYTNYTDDDGQESDGPALLIAADSIVAIEGDRETLKGLVEAMLHAIESRREDF